MARKKLKEAEEMSDLNSCTENEEYRKKSRRFRAAKVKDSSTSSNEELSDNSFISDLPNIPNSPKRHYSTSAHIAKKQKIATDPYKDMSKKH